MTPMDRFFPPYGGEYIQQIDFDGKEDTKMENKKKVYETPEVTKVEYDASDRITASGCTVDSSMDYLNYTCPFN